MIILVLLARGAGVLNKKPPAFFAGGFQVPLIMRKASMPEIPTAGGKAKDERISFIPRSAKSPPSVSPEFHQV